MIVLGIDQSLTKTGLVIANEDGVRFSGVIKTTNKDTDFDRVNAIKHYVLTVIGDHDPDVINIEGLSFGSSGNAARTLAGLQFVIVCSIVEHYPSIEVNLIAPTSLKAFVKRKYQLSRVTATRAKKRSPKLDIIDRLPESVYRRFVAMHKATVSGSLSDLADAYFLSNYINLTEK